MVRTLLAATVGAAMLSVTGTSNASCAPPTIRLSSYLARPGDTITITGEGFGEGCDDTPGDGGCFGGPAEQSDPYEDIPIDIRSKGGSRKKISLQVVDARANGTFRVQINIPDLSPGRYGITAGGSNREPLEVRKP